jgi:DNA replication and repair protein RecF
LSAGQERLEVRYRTALLDPPPAEELASGGALVARDWLKRSIERQREREIAAGVSLYGPHRDDMAFEVNGADATAFGSRGQQRTATLAMKLAELEYMRTATGEQPILLLDDATSELDARRRDAILLAGMQVEQTFMTSADGASLDGRTGASQRWEVAEGALRRLS